MTALTDTQPGPCIICGAIDYPLSVGGPTICPRCDCGKVAFTKVGGLTDAQLDALVETLSLLQLYDGDDPSYARRRLESAADAIVQLRKRLAETEGDARRYERDRDRLFNAAFNALERLNATRHYWNAPVHQAAALSSSRKFGGALNGSSDGTILAWSRP